MRVLITHTYYIQRGGEDLVFETEKRFLSQAGIDVRTLTFKNASWTFLTFLLYPFNPISFFKMLFYLKKHKPDLVHIHNWHFAASPSVIVACKLMNTPIIQTLHNHRLISFLDVTNKPTNSLSKIFTSWENKKKPLDFRLIQNAWMGISNKIYSWTGIWKLTDKYIVLTEKSKEFYLKSHFKFVSEKFIVKSNFIDGSNLPRKPKKDYLLYVGRLSYEKGVHILLSAFEGSDIKLKIIGEGLLKKEVETMIQTHPNIEYLGFKDFDYIKEAMAESMATIFPSTTLEGMPMTIIESFACGTPVIASRYSAMESMIQDGYNGFHFEIGNINHLREIILKTSKMTYEEINTLSSNSRLSYEEIYSPEININKLIYIYKELLQEIRNKRYKKAEPQKI